MWNSYSPVKSPKAASTGSVSMVESELRVWKILPVTTQVNCKSRIQFLIITT